MIAGKGLPRMLPRALGKSSKVVLLLAAAMALVSVGPAAPVVNKKLLAAAEAAANKSSTKKSPLESTLPSFIYAHTDSGILVDVSLAQVDANTATALTVAGVKVVHISSTYKRATVELTDLSALAKLAQIPTVVTISPVVKNQMSYYSGKARSEAVHALRSDTGGTTWRATGQGQKVGVLSDSFATTSGVRDGDTQPPIFVPGTLTGAKNQDSGDLPAQVNILLEGSGNDEGGGMAELIHDIAPDAALAFHTANGGEAVFADGITRLRNDGCTVVVDDVIYFAEPMFQTGIIEQSAEACVAAGVPYFSAAGNGGNKALSFVYKDSNVASDTETFPPDGSDLHQWSNGSNFLPVTIFPGTQLIVTLQWNQPFQSLSSDKGAQVDLDLYMAFAPTLAAVQRQAQPDGFSSTEIQGTTGAGKGDALEITGIVNNGFQPITVYLAVDHVHGEQDWIPQDPTLPLEGRLAFFGGYYRIEGVASDTDDTGYSSIYGHAVAKGAVAVGAVPWYDTPRFDTNFGATKLIDPEDFTALGGATRQYFDRYGNLVIRDLYSPTLASVDGNDTTFFIGSSVNLNGYDGEPDQFPNFFGTSAAAPNAAAVAAQMKSLDPTLDPAEITEIMTKTAIDVTGRRAAVGVDNTTGAGLVDAQAALEEVARRAGIGLPGTTGTPQVTVIPSPTPTPLPVGQKAFEFGSSDEGWTFHTIADFTPATGRYENGALLLEAANNQNTYGYYQSPWFIGGNWRQPGGFPINGVTGPDSLYRASVTVSSTTLNEVGMPTLRLRASVQDFSQTSEMTITSNVANGLPATLNSPKTYRHYFGLPAGKDRFRLYVDVLSFGGNDQAGAALILESVVVEGMSVPSLGQGRTDKSYAFGSDTMGWTFRNSPDFGVPVSVGNAEGLRIGPSLNVNGKTFFGYWGSTTSEPNPVRIQSDRVYRLRWRVGSNATEVQRLNVPAFRLRVNDSSLNFSTLVNIDSINSSSQIPVAGTDQEYLVYFEGRDELQTNRIGYSFDYILVPATQNDPTILLTLKSLKVDSFDMPVY